MCRHLYLSVLIWSRILRWLWVKCKSLSWSLLSLFITNGEEQILPGNPTYDNVWFRKRWVEFQGLPVCVSALRGWILSPLPSVTTNHSLPLNQMCLEIRAISHPTSTKHLAKCPLFEYQITNCRTQCLETRLLSRQMLFNDTRLLEYRLLNEVEAIKIWNRWMLR